MSSKIEGTPLAASHPDHPVMSRDELLMHVGKISQAIEQCGASPELTAAVTLASDLSFHLRRYFAAPVVERQPMVSSLHGAWIDNNDDLLARLIAGKATEGDQLQAHNHIHNCDIYEDVYGQLCDLMEPYVKRSFRPDGALPASIVEGFGIVFREWAELQATIARQESRITDLVSELLDKSAELKAMQRQRDAVKAQLTRECDDMDSALRLLGFDPEECRTDGGFLRISNFRECPTIVQQNAEIGRLKAEQPAPLSVAPTKGSYGCRSSIDGHHWMLNGGCVNCLDKIKELNQ